MRWVKVLCVVCLMLVCTEASARMCFRGRPLPDCRTFWLTEFTYGVQATEHVDRGHFISPDVGFMVNLTEKHAIGGSYFGEFLINSDHPNVFLHGPKLRYRYWLREGFNINASGALLLSSKAEFAADVGCIYKDWIGLGVRFEFWRKMDSQDSDIVMYPTVTVGGIPGLSLTSALAGALAAGVLLFVLAAGD